ncbi:serine hydrolase domain-containing protein [Bernardetia sp. ABR2-2B]|uniref:serine hydrolase domain-containing protein n=1 Tax=Bernardetia sp. ABR2-2B TaxID=3127472 RepID=UPI0030CBA660
MKHIFLITTICLFISCCKNLDTHSKSEVIKVESITGIVKNGQLAFASRYDTMSRDSDVAVDKNSLYQISSNTKKTTLSDIVNEEAQFFLEDKRFNALSIAVFDNGESYIGHYGEMDKGLGNKPTNKTLYEIASVSKTMTGYLVASAVEEGKLKLDDVIYDILGTRYQNLQYNGEPVRIKHLITHTSGLPLNIRGVSELYQNPSSTSYKEAQKVLTNYSKEDLLLEVQSLKLTQKPGENYGYSNIAPNLIAHILEIVYSKSFEELLKEKLFIPAKMLNTCINLNNEQKALLANGYNENNELMPNFKEPIQLWGAAGRIKSNSEDLLNYIKWQLNENNSIIKRSHEKLFHDVENIWIGYYWEVIDRNVDDYIEHHGGIYGSQNWIIIFPKQNVGVSIITNSSFPEANQLIKETANKIINKINYK